MEKQIKFPRYMIGEIEIIDRVKNITCTVGGFDTDSIEVIENEFNKALKQIKEQRNVT